MLLFWRRPPEAVVLVSVVSLFAASACCSAVFAASVRSRETSERVKERKVFRYSPPSTEKPFTRFNFCFSVSKTRRCVENEKWGWGAAVELLFLHLHHQQQQQQQRWVRLFSHEALNLQKLPQKLQTQQVLVQAVISHDAQVSFTWRETLRDKTAAALTLEFVWFIQWKTRLIHFLHLAIKSKRKIDSTCKLADLKKRKKVCIFSRFSWLNPEIVPLSGAQVL